MTNHRYYPCWPGVEKVVRLLVSALRALVQLLDILRNVH